MPRCQVAAANISANSLLAQIDNRDDGVIDGAAVISMSIAGNATVTNNATLAIYGSDGAAASAILINGGNYNVGGHVSQLHRREWIDHIQ